MELAKESLELSWQWCEARGISREALEQQAERLYRERPSA